VSTAPSSIAALRAALGRQADALDIEYVDETGSTNADLLSRSRFAAAKDSHRPCLLVAERQTAGRGRRGRSWQATPGASLTFSLAWPLRCADLSGLSLAVGVAIADAIDPAHAPQRHIAIKWPNDLWLVGGADEGRKLAGILIETTPIKSGRLAVIGVGINILEQSVAEAASGVAWLRQLDVDATPASTLERVVPALMNALSSFEEAGFAAFAARFAGRDLLRDRRVRCSGPAEGHGIDGVAAGVSLTGELFVRTGRGVEAVGSGEVSVRLADGRMSAMPEKTRAAC
jgi:BirA family biotin operon repressor/biotin-[acetyl-CoA-carboxylase] ligase